MNAIAEDRISIEHLSVFGLPPVEFVHLVADLGCRHLAIALTPVVAYNPHGYAPYSLRDDAALRRDLLAALLARDVSISLGGGLLLRDGIGAEAFAADLEIMRELGIRRINAVSMDPDLGRTFDELGALAETAGGLGMEATVEFAPGLTIPDLPTALDLLRHVGRPDLRLLVDSMHLSRSGSTAADLTAVDPGLIGYAQISDAPLVPVLTDYTEESMFERLVPGVGELPLGDFIAALPPDVIVGLEIPMRSQARRGVGPLERLRPCVEATRALLRDHT